MELRCTYSPTIDSKMVVWAASHLTCQAALRAGKVPLLGWTWGIRMAVRKALLSPSARAECRQDDFRAKSTMVPGPLKERPFSIRLSHSVCKRIRLGRGELVTELLSQTDTE